MHYFSAYNKFTKVIMFVIKIKTEQNANKKRKHVLVFLNLARHYSKACIFCLPRLERVGVPPNFG
jgi:hypothetical protein